MDEDIASLVGTRSRIDRDQLFGRLNRDPLQMMMRDHPGPWRVREVSNHLAAAISTRHERVWVILDIRSRFVAECDEPWPAHFIVALANAALLPQALPPIGPEEAASDSTSSLCPASASDLER